MFGPWGAAIGAGVGALIGFFTGKDDAEKKLKQAASSQFGIDVKDKEVLKAPKNLGEGMFGKGKVGPNADAVVRSENGMNILRSYAESSHQSGLKIDRLNMGDPDWKGNDFRQQFGGFREAGGPVEAGRPYIVGEKRPELFIPKQDGTILPSVPAGFGSSLVVDKDAKMQELMQKLLQHGGLFGMFAAHWFKKHPAKAKTDQQPDAAVSTIKKGFGGYREAGGSVRAGTSYVVGEHRPELFVPSGNGTIMPAVPNVTTTSGHDPQMMGQLMGLIDRMNETLSTFEHVPFDHVVAKGAKGASKHIADAYEDELGNDGYRGSNLARQTGQMY